VKALVPLVLVLALAVSGCGGGDDTAPAAASSVTKACPAQFAGQWQRLANRVGIPVFCPAWLPDPFTADVNSTWNNIDAVRRDRSYVRGWTWYEVQSGELHVNVHGFPGRSSPPRNCLDDARKKVSCFSDPIERKRIGGLDVTVFARGRALDTWHVVYGWRHSGSYYAVSQHVAKPLTYRQVRQNLNRIVRNLVLVRPSQA
jgi:hypothetical protein